MGKDYFILSLNHKSFEKRLLLILDLRSDFRALLKILDKIMTVSYISRDSIHEVWRMPEISPICHAYRNVCG